MRMTITGMRLSTMQDMTPTAIEVFNSWAAIGEGELPSDPIDAMQVQLSRWQRRNFSDVSPVEKIDVHMALGIVEEFCECANAEIIGTNKGKLDGLGDLCVYAGQMLIGNRIAIRPVIAMAEDVASDWFSDEQMPSSEKLIGDFVHATLKHDQRIRGMGNVDVWRAALCQHVARLMAFAKIDTFYCWSEALASDYDQIHLTFERLIERTYLDVGEKVVLKRDWIANPVDGDGAHK